jgi:hypothetical protein
MRDENRFNIIDIVPRDVKHLQGKGVLHLNINKPREVFLLNLVSLRDIGCGGCGHRKKKKEKKEKEKKEKEKEKEKITT